MSVFFKTDLHLNVPTEISIFQPSWVIYKIYLSYEKHAILWLFTLPFWLSSSLNI